MMTKLRMRSMFDYPLKDIKAKQKDPEFFIDSTGYKWTWNEETESFMR